MTREEAEQYLYYAMTIGEQLLCCGAEDVWKIPYGGSAWHMEPPGQMFFLSHPVL